jgi:hypothetical protein
LTAKLHGICELLREMKERIFCCHDSSLGVQGVIAHPPFGQDELVARRTY